MQTVTLQVGDELINAPHSQPPKNTFSTGNIVPSVYPQQTEVTRYVPVTTLISWHVSEHLHLPLWKPETKTTQNKMALGRPSLATLHPNTDMWIFTTLQTSSQLHIRHYNKHILSASISPTVIFHIYGKTPARGSEQVRILNHILPKINSYVLNPWYTSLCWHTSVCGWFKQLEPHFSPRF
jgi:hypothetical protein